MYIKQVCIFVQEHPDCFDFQSDIIPRDSESRQVHYKKLYFPKYKLEMCKKNAYLMAITIYNKLPIDIKMFSNIRKFKAELTIWLLSKGFYKVSDYLNEKRQVYKNSNITKK